MQGPFDQATFDRQPPFSMEAETAVLGALFCDRHAIQTVLPLVREQDFYREANRRIYRAAVALWEAGTALDIVTLVERLKAGGELEAAGGYGYLSSLLDAVPSAANVEHHARIVREKATVRSVIEISSAAIRDAYELNGEGLGALSLRVEQLAAALEGSAPGGFKTAKELLWPTMEHIERLQEQSNGVIGIPTGFFRLDRMLCGFQPGDLIIVAARPSVGKTALVMNMLVNAALTHKIPSGIVSLEMASEQLMMRALASEGRLDLQKLRRGKLEGEDHQRLAAAAGHINTAPLHIDDHPVSRVPELAAKVTQLVRRAGVKVLAIDYLQLMAGNGEENRRLEVGGITRSLKSLARRLNVPIILLSQLSRAPEGRTNHRPLLSDLRESGDIEQDADVVMFLYRPEMYVQDGDSKDARGKAKAQREALEGQTELIVAKQRNGPTGTVPLYFQKAYTRFDSVDDRGAQPGFGDE